MKVVLSNVVDAAGNRSPEVASIGSGKAYILRGGRMTAGTWRRPTVDDVTKFYNRNGDDIRLLPGVTWVELVPSTVDISASR